jgi:hypothetical protein
MGRWDVATLGFAGLRPSIIAGRMGMGDFTVAVGMGMGMGDLLLFEKDPTIVHPVDLVGGLSDKIHVVRYKDIGYVDILENAYDSFCGIRMKPCAGFIQEQDSGLHGKYRGKRDQFLFPPPTICG